MSEVTDETVPVALFFRVTPVYGLGRLRRFVEDVFEHSTVRDCFFGAADGDTGEIAKYDGFSVDWFDSLISDANEYLHRYHAWCEADNVDDDEEAEMRVLAAELALAVVEKLHGYKPAKQGVAQ